MFFCRIVIAHYLCSPSNEKQCYSNEIIYFLVTWRSSPFPYLHPCLSAASNLAYWLMFSMIHKYMDHIWNSKRFSEHDSDPKSQNILIKWGLQTSQFHCRNCLQSDFFVLTALVLWSKPGSQSLEELGKDLITSQWYQWNLKDVSSHTLCQVTELLMLLFFTSFIYFWDRVPLAGLQIAMQTKLTFNLQESSCLTFESER